MATGELSTNRYETRDGQWRSETLLKVDEVAASLRYTPLTIPEKGVPAENQAKGDQPVTGSDGGAGSSADAQWLAGSTSPWDN